MIFLAARKYATPRNGPLTLEQTETRRLAYSIKSTASPSIDFDTAAREMAALITGPCWLVPIPASDGSTRANTILAAHIARHVSRRFQLSGFSVSAFSASGPCQLAHALRRTAATESQSPRHRRNLPATPPEQHALKATLWSLGCRQVYFVDNVATSGNTLRAAYAAMNRGAGLVFADAGRNSHLSLQPSALSLSHTPALL